MKAREHKLRGNAGGEVPSLTRLKELANKSSGVAEDLWAMHEDAQQTNATIRESISKRLKIELARDGQLSEFWAWLRQKRRAQNWNARMEEFESWYRRQNPDASVERCRDAGIAFFMAETAAGEDRKGFVEIARLDLDKRKAQGKAVREDRALSLQERRIRVLEKKAEQADAAKGLLENKSLSQEERISKMRAVFGI